MALLSYGKGILPQLSLKRMLQSCSLEKGRDKKFHDLGMGEYKSPKGNDFFQF